MNKTQTPEGKKKNSEERKSVKYDSPFPKWYLNEDCKIEEGNLNNFSVIDEISQSSVSSEFRGLGESLDKKIENFGDFGKFNCEFMSPVRNIDSECSVNYLELKKYSAGREKVYPNGMREFDCTFSELKLKYSRVGGDQNGLRHSHSPFYNRKFDSERKVYRTRKSAKDDKGCSDIQIMIRSGSGLLDQAEE